MKDNLVIWFNLLGDTVFIKWLHHLFNPHCPACEADTACKTCSTLRELLEIEKFEKKQLLNHLLEPTTNSAPYEGEPKEIRPKSIPWRIRKEMLETEDRERARILAKKNLEISELEKSLGVDDASEKSEAI